MDKEFVIRSGIAQLTYGQNSNGYYYEVRDWARNMILEQSSTPQGLSPVVMVEKMRMFGVCDRHLINVGLLRGIDYTQ